MIKVIIDNTTEIKVQDVTPKHFIGVKRCGEKAFVTREKYEMGFYKLLSTNQLTKGNGYCIYDEPTLAGLLKNLINANFEVFVFETSKELFTWLAAE